MIICGHALIGKSTLAKKVPLCVDLESSIFCQGNFQRYAEMAIALHQQGKVVLLSCHAAIRDALRIAGLSYVLVLPHKEEKERYYQLAKSRQPHPLQPELVLSQWDNWQERRKDEVVYTLPIGRHLSDVLLFAVLENMRWRQKGANSDDLRRQLAEARAEIERLRGVILSQITPEPLVLSSYSATTEPAKDERDKLIERLREALEWAMSFPKCTCNDQDNRWQAQVCVCGHADNVRKALAALAAERIRP